MGVSSLVGGDFWAAKTLLRQAGIDAEQEMKIRVIGGTVQRLLALRTGLVHATTLSVPSDLLAEKKEGLKRLAFAGDFVEDFSSGIGVSLRLLKERPDQIKKLAKTIFKAMAHAKAHPRESAELVMSKWNLDRDTATEAFDMVAKTWADNGVPPDAFLQGAMRQAQGEKPLPPLSEVGDLTLARDTFRELQKK
jgi:ABC-type nitrate/sulfonate/bicarbonate transport system substrate-binding protein